MTTEPVETFVFLPFSQYKALDSRAKRMEPEVISSQVLEPPQPNEETEVSTVDSPIIKDKPESLLGKDVPLGKDMTKHYRSVQIKKILQNIKKNRGSEQVVSLSNLDDLIQAALTNKRKKLPNEEVFFTFLFENGMGHFVKNRSKIGLYYKDGLWYQV